MIAITWTLLEFFQIISPKKEGNSEVMLFFMFSKHNLTSWSRAFFHVFKAQPHFMKSCFFHVFKAQPNFVILLLAMFFFFLPNFNLKDVISTYTKDFSWKKKEPKFAKFKDFIYLNFFYKLPDFYDKFQ
jgi:hypothetical protein